MSDFWKQYEKAAEAESGGGGIICRAEIATVYKGFVQGLDQADAYRAVAPDATDQVKNAAKAEITALGADRAQYGVQVRALRDSAVSRGKAVTWQADRFFFQATWNDACKTVVVPSLKSTGITTLPFEGWVRIGFKPNPFNVTQGDAGKTDADAEGNLRFPQVAYIVEVFPNADAAREAIGGTSADEIETAAPVTPGDAPEGWDFDAWKSIWPELHAAKDAGQSVKEIADGYEVSVPAVVKALKDYIPM